MATNDDYELNAPALAKQTKIDSCWACCMTNLLKANGSAKQMSEKDLISTYATTPEGGIDVTALKTIAKDFNYISNPFMTSASARSVITANFVISILKRSGMMMMAWKVEDATQPGKTFFHAQIVWGVIYMINQDIGTDRALIHTMNPWTKTYQLYPLFWILRPENMPLFTCWPNGT